METKSKNLLSLQNGSDIRGIASEGVDGEHVTLTAQLCAQIAVAFSVWLSKKTGKLCAELKIGIGRDSRISGESLASSVMVALHSRSVSVFDCRLATTPAMFMSIVFAETKFDGAVMVTASHLPFNRNGLKFFTADGCLESADITEILENAQKIQCDASMVRGKVRECELISLYASYLCGKIKAGVKKGDAPLSGLSIVVDAGNGAGGFFATNVLAALGADITGSQFLNPDGMFPNHIPNPENAEAMASLKSAVLKNDADLGLIFDTDVDRMAVVLSDGTEVNRDAIIALVSAILAPEYPNSTIITDSVTSDRLTKFLETELGLKQHRFKRGYKNVINECKRLNEAGTLSPLAMETSGHGALKENFYLDDGAYLAVKIIIALAQAKAGGKSLSSLIENLEPLCEAMEVRYKITCEDFSSYGDMVLAEFKKTALEQGLAVQKSYEGVRISFDDSEKKGWLLLRKSLHERVMPLNIEGSRSGDCKKIFDKANELLSAFPHITL